METPLVLDVQRAVGDRYEILALAGSGSMGTVFRARHRALGHIVAIKVLDPEVAASEMRQARFHREASLAAALSHPNIVPVYEFDARDGITFLIMPFVRGSTLADLGGRIRGDAQAVLRVLWDVGAALDYAHQHGVIHRDVKPSNVLIEEDTGRALLTDFGVARKRSVSESSLTAPGSVIGTLDYMAPEQVAGRDVDGRADLYSLAVIGFELLTGTRPAPGSERSALAKIVARPLGDLASAQAFVTVLAREPDDRPATARDWLSKIERARRWRRPVLAAVGAALVLLIAAGFVIRPWWKSPPRAPSLAVMPFTVLGTAPYPPAQLPAYFISRFSPVPKLGEVLSFGKVLAQAGQDAPSSGDAEAAARRLGARYFIRGNVEFAADGQVTLTTTLYEVGRKKPRRSGTATGSVDRLSDVMDQAWAKLLPNFAPNPYGTIPRGKEAIAAYFNAEDAFRAGDYREAREAYQRVIELDSTCSVAHLRLALVAGQVDASEAGFGAALTGAWQHETGLSPADSVLLEGFSLLVRRGDGWSAAERFRRATELAPEYAHTWFAQGEFVYHFGNLFGEPLSEAEDAFNRVLDLDPTFEPAIAHLISLTYMLHNDHRETERLMRDYLRADSVSVVAEAVGIADTLLFGSLSGRGRLLHDVERHSPTALQFLAFQAAIFGDEAARRGPTRRILAALQHRATTDPQRVQALRMSIAANLRNGWADSAQTLLRRVFQGAALRERDEWLVLAHVSGLPSLGPWRDAAERLDQERLPSTDDESTRHWLLARAGIRPAVHRAALQQLATDSSPLPLSLSLDLAAREAVAGHDTAKALALWDTATQRYSVLAVPLGLVNSLWPIRLEVVRVSLASGDMRRAEATCGTFDTLIGYADQAAWPEVERLCAPWRQPRTI